MARPETLPILETAAKGKDTEIRLVAVWALGDTELPQAIAILLRTVKEDDPDPELRDARREVLERLRSAATGAAEVE
jgi:HEAT repeat protein